MPENPEHWLFRPCSDHGCIWGHPGGMGTNGGCQHLKATRAELRMIVLAMSRMRTRESLSAWQNLLVRATHTARTGHDHSHLSVACDRVRATLQDDT